MNQSMYRIDEILIYNVSFFFFLYLYELKNCLYGIKEGGDHSPDDQLAV